MTQDPKTHVPVTQRDAAANADHEPVTIDAALLRIASLAWREKPPVELEFLSGGWGEFQGPLDVRMLDEGRKCELLAPYGFTRPDGSAWPVPKGWIVDGASIPRPFWALIGGPLDQRYRNASVVHDYYCDEHLRPWRDTHRMFYEGMRRMDVAAAKAKIMYYAVYRFGPRWPEPGALINESIPAAARPIDPPTLAADAEAIYFHDLSIEEIERLADARNGPALSTEVVTEAAGDPVPARVRALVICGGTGDAADLEAVAREAANLPPFVIDRFERKQIRIVACRDSVTNFERSLEGKTPRGWENTKKTWDDVPGTYLTERNRVVIATVGDGANRFVPTKSYLTAKGHALHGSDNLVIHESLHGFDYCGHHKVLSDPRFTNAREADLPHLQTALMGYLIQAGQPGLEETFAESGARHAVGPDAMRQEWPNLAGYWQSGGPQSQTMETPALEAVAGAEDVIGSAILQPGGAIMLDLRAEGPGGAIGHAAFTLRPGDEAYEDVRQQLTAGAVVPESTGAVRFPFVVQPETGVFRP